MVDVRVFASPSRYVQGPGAFDRLGEWIAPFGETPIIVTDEPVLALLGDRLDRIMREADLRPRVAVLCGEITYDAVDGLVQACADASGGVVVAIGGGKALDAGKAVALRIGLPVVTVPTIASNDSPTSSAIAMYDGDHALIAVDHLSVNPAMVIVDTSLIAAAPANFLRSGIGDALSKRFEADACFAGTGVTPLGTRPLSASRAIANSCYETLREYGIQAIADCEANLVTVALERVVEAVILMSGLAFENGGLSLAHSLTRGLLKVDGARGLAHGQHVAWGTLVQVAAEGREDDEILDLLWFVRSAGLPVSSSDLQLVAPTADAFAEIARHTMTAPHLANFPIDVTEALIIASAQRIDVLARADEHLRAT